MPIEISRTWELLCERSIIIDINSDVSRLWRQLVSQEVLALLRLADCASLPLTSLPETKQEKNMNTKQVVHLSQNKK